MPELRLAECNSVESKKVEMPERIWLDMHAHVRLQFVLCLAHIRFPEPFQGRMCEGSSPSAG